MVRTTAVLEFKVPLMVIEKLPVGVPVGDKLAERQPARRSSASIRPAAASLGRESQRLNPLAARAGVRSPRGRKRQRAARPMIPIMSPVMGRSGHLPVGPRPDPRGHDDVKVVLIVTDTLLGDVPFGVTLVEENAQVEPGG